MEGKTSRNVLTNSDLLSIQYVGIWEQTLHRILLIDGGHETVGILLVNKPVGYEFNGNYYAGRLKVKRRSVPVVNHLGLLENANKHSLQPNDPCVDHCFCQLLPKQFHTISVVGLTTDSVRVEQPIYADKKIRSCLQ
jgi:hypothetical protein